MLTTTLASFTAILIAMGPGPAVVPAVSGGGEARTTDAERRVAQRPNRRDKRLERKRRKLRERIRTLRAWKLTEALSLDEATAASLFPILNRYDDRMEKVMREAGALRRSLRRAVEGGKAGEVDKLIDQLLAKQKRLFELQRTRFAEIRKVLKPGQAAKILIVLPEIDRKIFRQIRRAMRRGADRPDRDDDVPF